MYLNNITKTDEFIQNFPKGKLKKFILKAEMKGQAKENIRT